MKKSIFALAIFALATGAVHAQSAQYKIDPNHTRAIFEAKHFGTSTNRGQWEKSEGEITLDKTAKTGKVDITLDMNSISTGVAAFNNHLKSADFFDVTNHPTAKFVGDKFKFDGDKLVEVTGDLTLRGKTNPITIRTVNFGCYTHPTLKREICGGDFETVLTRSAFDVNWGLANRATSDDIKVILQVEAIKQ